MIKDINREKKDQSVELQGVIEQVFQTGGPTIFTINDGTGSFKIKGFIAPGKRAFPEIEQNHYVNTKILIKEYNGNLEGEIQSIQRLSEQQEEALHKKQNAAQYERAKPKNTDLLISSPILDKLKESMIEAATLIRLAVFEHRPILIRHHNDTDGYSSGYTLERALIPLVEEHHGEQRAGHQFVSRAPCAAPFYDIEDSIKDSSRALSGQARFSEKMPLVLVVDNGSSHEDLLAIKQVKVHGMQVIVIDHHFFEKDYISDEVIAHVNPFLVGEDGSQFSAGMLCTEIARLVYPVKGIEHIPALAGLADRIDNDQAMDQYYQIAEQHGYSKDFLGKLSGTVDFISAKIRFMEAREYIDVLMGNNKEQQQKLVELLAPAIKQMEDKALAIGLSQVQKEMHGTHLLQIVDIEKTFSRSTYPKPGKATGLVHDTAKEENPAVVSIGIMSDVVTIRATDATNFSVHEYIDRIHQAHPDAFADGGGHKHAGSIKFVPAHKENVLNVLREYLDNA